MSFSTDVKEELVHIKNACEGCNIAMLSAILAVDAEVAINQKNGLYRFDCVCDFNPLVRFVLEVLHKNFDLKTETVFRRSVLHHTQNYQIKVPYQASVMESLLSAGIITNNGALEQGIRPDIIAKPCCKKAYLRGIFLASGFIGDPRSNFHLEIIVEKEQLAYDILSIMKELDINARVVPKRQSYMIYMKSGSNIENFLACIGASTSHIKFTTVRVNKSLRNEANRLSNAEFANVDRATKASVKQLKDIQIVLKKYKSRPDSIPPAIKEFIELRVANPSASMKELGQLAKPAMTKSAINHRARRLEEIARKIESESLV